MMKRDKISNGLFTSNACHKTVEMLSGSAMAAGKNLVLNAI